MQVMLSTQHVTLARLATASMCTGYTLSNAEMRLNLDRQLRSVESLPVPEPSPPPHPLPALPELSPAARAQLPADIAAHIAILEARISEQQRLMRRSPTVCLQVCSMWPALYPPLPPNEAPSSICKPCARAAATNDVHNSLTTHD